MRALDENELEALRLFANGRTADEMAIALDMSKSAAQYYLRVAARKLGARNRVHAVAIAVELGLVKPSDSGSRQAIGQRLKKNCGRLSRAAIKFTDD